MTPKRLTYLAAGLMIAGALLIWLGLQHTFILRVDGQSTRVSSRSLTVSGVLNAAHLSLTPSDRVTPSLGAWLFSPSVIDVQRAAQVQVWAGSLHKVFLTAERYPANLAGLAGLKLFPGDQIYLDGQTVDPNKPLPAAASYTLQVRQAFPITIHTGSTRQTIYSSAATLGEALWQAGLRLDPADKVQPALRTPLAGALSVNLQAARDLTITLAGGTAHLKSAAATVGQALAEAGIALEGMDYSQPAETAPVPLDGRIRVVRVREEIVLDQKPIPFKNTYQLSPEVELDHTQVVQPGVVGLQVSRVRVRYEDGKEISRQTDAQWIARQPKDQVVGYGTKVVVRTAVVDGVTIEYWRAIQVYATSYDACSAGNCNASTASGLPAKKGVIAVLRSWYNQMVGQQVYVPGYGRAVVGDIGGGIPGKDWIDLAYSNDDYVAWHQTVTLYFLTPVPANIPWILP